MMMLGFGSLRLAEEKGKKEGGRREDQQGSALALPVGGSSCVVCRGRVVCEGTFLFTWGVVFGGLPPASFAPLLNNDDHDTM